jgi:hypothetical protein
MKIRKHLQGHRRICLIGQEIQIHKIRIVNLNNLNMNNHLLAIGNKVQALKNSVKELNKLVEKIIVS